VVEHNWRAELEAMKREEPGLAQTFARLGELTGRESDLQTTTIAEVLAMTQESFVDQQRQIKELRAEVKELRAEVVDLRSLKGQMTAHEGKILEHDRRHDAQKRHLANLESKLSKIKGES
jgi:predicted RNase H-like nuclease (RuvC/YqgF family)